MSAGGTLSVVVIGRNEGERLRQCLLSVLAMEHGAWHVDVIYVDSNSSDGSLALAANLGVQTIALQPKRPTAALARNAGWRAATGELVLFLDGDTVLANDFFTASLPDFNEPRMAVVWGHRRELYPERSLYNRVLDLDWIYAPGLAPFCGGDALFRRAALVKTGGFDETLIAGEEPELCRRILTTGDLILHTDRPMTGHDLAVTSFGQYWQRATRAGHAFAEVAQRFAKESAPFWSDEVRRNRVRATTLVGAAVVVILATALLRSTWPLVAGVALFAMMVVRTAWKARWKSRNRATLLLYGLHSHVQQLPIYYGQVRFAFNRRRGVRAHLVEYKQP